MIECIEEKLNEVFKKLGYTETLRVVLSNRPELCDYQCNDLFRLAKIYHKKTLDIAHEIISSLEKEESFSTYFLKVEFANPGFINITVSDQLINKMLEKMANAPKFGIQMPKQKKRFVLDYGGPNVAKPLHVGHMRTAIVGESIKRIIKYMGHEVISDVHLGDYGLQIGQVIYGILQDHKSADEIDLAYLEKIYPKISILCKEDKMVREKCAQITKDLQDGNLRYQKLFRIILKISGNDIKRLYQYLGVSFDVWKGESDAYSYIEKTRNYLQKYIKESEGALIIELEDEKGPIPPLLFRKSNGAYLYATTDLATIYQRMEDYNPDHILYIVDNRQYLHFKQVFGVCKKSGLTKNTTLEFLGYGTINGADGKPFKTRNGDAPKLDDLFMQTKNIFISKKESNQNMNEEDLVIIVNAILKFADLQNSREKDYIFDIQKFGDVIGKTGPYILYTYLPIQKIIQSVNKNQHLTHIIYNKVDRDLRLKLLSLENALKLAFEERKPHYIADFIYNVCVLVNVFYQNNHLANLEDEQKKNDWIYVLSLSNRIIKEMLMLIGITIPSHM